MPKIILFNKPFQVLSAFTSKDNKTTLAKYIEQPNYYPAGRLDYDSEGLLILTNNGQLQHRLANPKFKLKKTYLVQVEGKPTEQALQQLRQGIELKDGLTKPAEIKLITTPDIPAREQPIRKRKNQPTSWLQLKIIEGKNRQVRRMTAAIGYPTLRLIRYAIGQWTIEGLKAGQSKQLNIHLPNKTNIT